ncbi:S-layer homology domain-containing protein [Butyricicoccus faecihominis]|uniref:S-layer homology domain-containing protein n=1 Tax=Butyricicoccus faecihominis TaxID=1712515 RepID=UPI00247888D9|nr:S-layer homology domain-containing protein [Butyricicoccus faecihominis]MCQ5131220.1 S-layer homology domain-containing protein [Butyricicoccus faecihominis]
MKLHRKLAGLVSAAVVLSSLSVGAFAASPSDFADMPSDWSRPALENAINNGLLNGSDGKINASGLLTRAELAAIVNRAFGATKTADISAYTDVPASAWYYADMQKAVHMGTFEGSGNKLSPASAITRQEAFTVLARAFSLADGSASSLSKFSDASAVSSWAKGPVAALTEAGYVNGSGGKLNPTASITRAEFAQIADNLVSAYLPKEYTGTADGNAMVREAGAVLDKADIKGDLILGDGVGDGNVTIKDSKIAGRLVVRGGGVHSIIISGSTEIGTVVVSKVDGNVRVATEGNAKVQTIVVDDGKDDVIIEGTVGKVEIASANVPVVLQNAKVDEVVVSAAGADVTVDKNSTVKTVTVDKAAANTALTVAGKVDTVAVQGNNTTVTAEKGATIAKVQTAAANTEVKGDGKVTKVEAQAGSTGARVTTPGTSITVDKGADAVKTDKGTVEPGKTGSTSGTTTGGGGGGGGGSSTTTETLEGYLPAPLADGAVTDYKVDVTKTSNRDYIDVKVSGTNLQYSLNADTTYHLNDDTTAVGGFWAGVAVPVPEKADAAHTQFSWTNGDWVEAADTARAFKQYDNKDGCFMVFYSDLADAKPEDHLQIVWKDAENQELSTQKFVVDYSGVTLGANDEQALIMLLEGGKSAILTEDIEIGGADQSSGRKENLITIPENQTVMLDLNGHTLTAYINYSTTTNSKNQTVIDSRYFVIKNNGNLTLKDSQGSGKITMGSDNSMIGNFGKLQVESGEYENTLSCLTAIIENDSDMTMTGGLLTGGVGIAAYGSDSVTKMTGGKIGAQYHGIASNGTIKEGVQIYAGYTVTIGGAAEIVSDDTGLYMPADGTVNIEGNAAITSTGAELKNGEAYAAAVGIDLRVGTLNITGGSVTCNYAQNESAKQIGGQSGSLTGAIIAGKPAGYTGTTSYIGDINVRVNGGKLVNTEGDAFVLNLLDAKDDKVNVQITDSELTGSARMVTPGDGVSVWAAIPTYKNGYAYPAREDEPQDGEYHLSYAINDTGALELRLGKAIPENEKLALVFKRPGYDLPVSEIVTLDYFAGETAILLDNMFFDIPTEGAHYYEVALCSYENDSDLENRTELTKLAKPLDITREGSAISVSSAVRESDGTLVLSTAEQADNNATYFIRAVRQLTETVDGYEYNYDDIWSYTATQDRAGAFTATADDLPTGEWTFELVKLTGFRVEADGSASFNMTPYGSGYKATV